MNEVAEQIDRQDAARLRILAALQSGPQSSAQLNAVCYRYGARIMELRREGWPITARRLNKSLWTYEITGPREERG